MMYFCKHYYILSVGLLYFCIQIKEDYERKK